MPDAPITLLIVEDEAIVARDLQRTLEDIGYHVLPTAGTCDEAIKRAADRCPDLVLMDIRLHGHKDGIDAAEILHDRFSVPVVFLTAYADDATVARAKKAQPYGYLLKPIRADELRSTVEVALYKHRMEQQIALAERLLSAGTMAAGVASAVGEPLDAFRTKVNQAGDMLKAHRTEIATLLSLHSGSSLFGRLDDIQGALADAAAEAARAASAISELTALAGARAERRGLVDLRRALLWACEVVAHEIRSRAALAMEIRAVPHVAAEDARLGQVFVNLLLNAAAAIDPGDADAHEVRVTAHTAEDGRAIVEVRDTGRGIPRELLGRIFDPFFKGATTPANNQTAGRGLGLAICQGIVRSLGGEIQVESRVGQGSLFRVLLPPAPAAPAAAGAGPTRVLAVLDSTTVAAAVRRVLEPEYHVACVGTVREAKALVHRSEVFDVILCDLVLPEVTGMDFYDDLLRTRPDLARRVVFMNDPSPTSRVAEFVASVSNPCLERPLTAQALRAAIRQALGGGH